MKTWLRSLAVKFSPDGDTSERRSEIHDTRLCQGAGRSCGRTRSNVLFIPAIPMVFLALNDGADRAHRGAGLGRKALTGAACLLRGGLHGRGCVSSRAKSRADPALPRKIFSSALTGLGIAHAPPTALNRGMVAPFLYGSAAAMGLHVAAFGIDPLRSKGMEGVDTLPTRPRGAASSTKAEKDLRLEEMSDAMLRSQATARWKRRLNAGFQDQGPRFDPHRRRRPARPHCRPQVSGRLFAGRTRRDREVRGHLQPHRKTRKARAPITPLCSADLSAGALTRAPPSCCWTTAAT